MDIIKKRPTNTNVALKSKRSRPRLVKEVPLPPPKVLPKPVPLACIKIRTIKATEVTIWPIVNTCVMKVIITERTNSPNLNYSKIQRSVEDTNEMLNE
jgi:hypothetical protein